MRGRVAALVGAAAVATACSASGSASVDDRALECTSLVEAAEPMPGQGVGDLTYLVDADLHGPLVDERPTWRTPEVGHVAIEPDSRDVEGRLRPSITISAQEFLLSLEFTDLELDQIAGGALTRPNPTGGFTSEPFFSPPQPVAFGSAPIGEAVDFEGRNQPPTRARITRVAASTWLLEATVDSVSTKTFTDVWACLSLSSVQPPWQSIGIRFIGTTGPDTAQLEAVFNHSDVPVLAFELWTQDELLVRQSIPHTAFADPADVIADRLARDWPALQVGRAELVPYQVPASTRVLQGVRMVTEAGQCIEYVVAQLAASWVPVATGPCGFIRSHEAATAKLEERFAELRREGGSR